MVIVIGTDFSFAKTHINYHTSLQLCSFTWVIIDKISRINPSSGATTLQTVHFVMPLKVWNYSNSLLYFCQTFPDLVVQLWIGYN